MELEGRVIAILEERRGQGRNGEWRSQSYVIEINDNSQYPRHLVFDLWGDKIDQNKNLIQMNNNIKVSFDIDAREYQGRWFTTIRAWKIEQAGVGAPVAAAQPAAAQMPPISQPAAAPTQSFSAPTTGAAEPAGDSSDLPF